MESSASRQPTVTRGNNKPNGNTSSKHLLRLFVIGLGSVLFFTVLFLIHMLFLPWDTSHLYAVVFHIFTVCGQLLGMYFCFSSFLPYWRRRQACSALAENSGQVGQRWMWVPFWIGLVFLINALADAIYTYCYIYQIHLAQDWPNAIYLVHYPCLLLAIFSLPQRPLSPAARIRVVLDGLQIATALCIFCWYFLFGPIMLLNDTNVFIKLVGMAFPFGDVVLGYCLFQMTLQRSEPALETTRRFMLLGLAGIIIANCLEVYQVVQNTSMFDLWATLSEAVGYMLIVLAAWSVRYVKSDLIITPVRQTSFADTAPPPFWRSLFPYSFVPAVVILMIYVWYVNRSGPLAGGVYLGVLILIAQVVLRQILVIREIFYANRALQRVQQELHANNAVLSEANQNLEERARELDEAYEQQRQVNEVKDQFLLNVNHELRTPLTEIHGYLELLHEYQGHLDEATRATFLAHALHGSEELQRLVDTVLNALRSDSSVEKLLHWEDLQLLEVVHSALNLFEPQKREQYQIEIVVPETLMVRADRQYTHQILCNLISNAFKYSSPGTKVTIGACEGICLDHEGEGAPSACVWVQDAGPGISATEIPKLFGKFVRLKRDQASAVRGTGLGLYISKQLVEAMGGRIWVESTGVPGEGSHFSFTLPVVMEVGQREDGHDNGDGRDLVAFSYQEKNLERGTSQVIE